ncbi:type 2 lanthipeptide synthetase LanM [Roseburia hominis]
MNKNGKMVYFPQFYERYFQKALRVFFESAGEEKEYINQEINKNLRTQLANKLQNICIRILITYLHLYKEQGKLQGKDSREEYTYFCERIVGSEEFYKKICEEFPVLEHCVQEQITFQVNYFLEIIHHFQQEKEEIERVLCKGKKAGKIIKISSEVSDSHHEGKVVLKVYLDNGYEIFYKPHDMKNEKVYGELLRWFTKETGITQYEYPIISHKDHSWCEVVVQSDCSLEVQIKNYYQRVGGHVFLTYLLGTRDLHYENIIAAGEYPVLVDLEAIFSVNNSQPEVSVEKEVRRRLNQSVLASGLLPVYVWNKYGEGVNICALNGKGGQLYPVELPYIENGGTSDMRIAYQKRFSKPAKNLAKKDGEFMEPSHYKKEILRGYIKAYCAAMRGETELLKIIDGWEEIHSRIILCDTQRYTMLLSASYHPDLMRDETDRERFLCSLWKGRKENQKCIVECEVASLLRGDIPYFYVKSHDTGLYSEGENIKNSYLICTIGECVVQRLSELCIGDMKHQCEYIEASLELGSENKENCRNKMYCVKDKNGLSSKEVVNIELYIENLTKHLWKNAIWNKDHTEVSWEVVRFSTSKKSTWNLSHMNPYLYDGLAGMLLVVYSLADKRKWAEIREMYQVLRNQLFHYTALVYQSEDYLQTRKTGLYEGESSIVYAYLILLELSGEEAYLEQARKHMEVVIALLDEDHHYDLLSGNAGAAAALIKLYEITAEERYLKEAERAIGLLSAASIKMQYGIGWRVCDSFEPMSGMAHGNSGILIPVVSLWRLTGKEKYREMAQDVLLYEESLYDPETNNWRDIRKCDEKDEQDQDSVAWCHGAAGILFSRLKCMELLNDCNDLQMKSDMERDILRAYKKVKECWLRDSWSLCHGICGNLWILEMAEKEIREYGIEEERMISGRRKIGKKMLLLPQEKMNPGFMNGYGGMLYWMLQR